MLVFRSIKAIPCSCYSLDRLDAICLQVYTVSRLW